VRHYKAVIAGTTLVEPVPLVEPVETKATSGPRSRQARSAQPETKNIRTQGATL
jgi:hypothetical protein